MIADVAIFNLAVLVEYKWFWFLINCISVLFDIVTETPFETIEFQELIVVVAFCIINLSPLDNDPFIKVGSGFAKMIYVLHCTI